MNIVQQLTKELTDLSRDLQELPAKYAAISYSVKIVFTKYTPQYAGPAMNVSIWKMRHI